MSASILDTIKGPLDLKKLTLSEMETLAIDVRQRIVDVMATKGGHLASSLGAVEINLALHKVFNSPKDKFIFDVGHQTYTHKIVTGRNEQFDTIRQYKGLCGFTHPEESPHDHFHAGHAGTALSLGLGAATTRDLDEGTEHVIPVIGDATLPFSAQHMHQQAESMDTGLNADSSGFGGQVDLRTRIAQLYDLFAKIGMDITVRERMPDDSWKPDRDAHVYLTNHRGLGIFWVCVIASTLQEQDLRRLRRLALLLVHPDKVATLQDDCQEWCSKLTRDILDSYQEVIERVARYSSRQIPEPATGTYHFKFQEVLDLFQNYVITGLECNFAVCNTPETLFWNTLYHSSPKFSVDGEAAAVFLDNSCHSF